MTHKPYNLEEILSAWGKSQQRISSTHDVLKAEILSKQQTAPLPQAKQARSIPWLPVAIAGFAVLTFFLHSTKVGNYVAQNSSRSYVTSPTGMTLQEKSLAPNFDYPYPNNNFPISDPREFLKKDFNAQIKTRNVPKLSGRVQTTIRGFDGRLDASTIGGTSAYFSFVLPATRLDSFRAEIKSLIPGWFYTEQTSEQNLLPQKQSIEQAQKQAQDNLKALEAQRDQLISNHNRTIASFKSRLSAIAKELTALNNEETNDPARQAEIAARIQQLKNSKKSVENQMANEITVHTQNLAGLNAQIQSAGLYVENVKAQDQNLLDNVATVSGTITLSRVNLWQWVDLYLPGPLLSWLLLAAAVGVYLRHSYIPKLKIPA